MATGEAILDLRARIAQAGAPLGLDPPPALETAYEGAGATDLDGVLGSAQADLDAAGAIATAAGRVDAPRDPLTALGLLGVKPEAELQASVSAFRANRIDEARSHTDQAVAWLDAAPEFGTRTVGGMIGAGLVILALIVATIVLRRRSRRAAARALAAGTVPGALWGPGATPAATLPSQSTPELPGADGGVEPTVSEPSPAPPDETAD